MCDIAGYVGKRRAAPVLMEMIARQELFDGYMSTGLATIDAGKLVSQKCFGNSDAFKEKFDISGFGGNIGMAHTKPSANYVSNAHPFLDNGGVFACAMNGIHRDIFCDKLREDCCAAAKTLAENGVTFLSEERYPDRNMQTPLELRAALYNGNSIATGDLFVNYTAFGVKNGKTVAEAFADAMSVMPSDIAGVIINAEKSDTIYACRVTRPLVVAVCKDETYIATTRFAFPEGIDPVYVMPLPPCTVCEIKAGQVNITPHTLKNVAVEGVSPYVYKCAWDRINEMLTGREEDPCDFDAVEDAFYTKWRDLWRRPLVECEYKAPNGCLKQYAHLVYEVLYDLDRAGLLKKKQGEVNGKQRYLMWI